MKKFYAIRYTAAELPNVGIYAFLTKKRRDAWIEQQKKDPRVVDVRAIDSTQAYIFKPSLKKGRYMILEHEVIDYEK